MVTLQYEASSRPQVGAHKAPMPMNNDPMSADDEVYRLLLNGTVSDPQLTPLGSNYTFLVNVSDGDKTCQAIYKPKDGEAPLWDFPSGTLYKREYAAYLLSRILGWDFIPLTLVRDGPYGVGSLQLCIDHHPRANYYYIREKSPDDLRMIALYDLVANNADRKASHCIVDSTGKVWGIDHGLTFHWQPKLRTVIWDFGWQPMPEGLLDDLKEFLLALESRTGCIPDLEKLVFPEEMEALGARVRQILEIGVYPGLGPRPYPF